MTPRQVSAEWSRQWVVATAIRLLSVAAVAVLSAGLAAGSAHADTGLEVSTPANGSTVNERVDKIELHFDRPVTRAPKASILNAAGETIPSVVAPGSNGELWDIIPASTLDQGMFGVTWKIVGNDGHAASGTFSFTVAGTSPDASESSQLSATLAESTEASEGNAVEGLAWVGRWLTSLGALLGIGGLIFAAGVYAGSRSEVGRLFRYVRTCGLIAVIGCAVQLATQAALVEGGGLLDIVSPTGWGQVLTTGFGWGLVMALIGAFFIFDGAIPAGRQRFEHTNWHPRGMAARLAPSGRDVLLAARPEVDVRTEPRMITPTLARSRLAVIGAILLLCSMLLTGHSVTSEPRWLVALATLAHTIAAAVWVGGVAALVLVLADRFRRRRPLRAAELVLRFGILAGPAAAVTGAAGVILAVSILDSPSELVATAWGRVLLVKLLVVGVVVSIASYNHFRVLPALRAGEPGSNALLRRTATWEGLVMVVILAVTAWLVASAS